MCLDLKFLNTMEEFAIDGIDSKCIPEKDAFVVSYLTPFLIDAKIQFA